MLYLLPIILLIVVLFGDNNDCNSIIFTNPLGERTATPTGQCQILLGRSLQFLCNGTEINYIAYNSTDCSGNPAFIQHNVCQLSDDNCTTICDKSNCNGISVTLYDTNDTECSDDIQTKFNFLPGICVGSSTRAQQLTCIDNGKIQVKQYSSISTNCEGDPVSSIVYDPICTTRLGSTMKYAGCDSSSNTIFTLFGAVITILFILSL